MTKLLRSYLLNILFVHEQALLHASVARRKKLVIDWIPASDLEQGAKKEVCFTLYTNLLLTTQDTEPKRSLYAESRCI